METESKSVWTPNEELLDLLLSMGISKIAAEHALFCTGNNSAEAAASYVFDNPDVDTCEQLPQSTLNPDDAKKKVGSKTKSYCLNGVEVEYQDDSTTTEETDDVELGYKMVFVVNMALNMGIGKIAAQVAHACLGLYRSIDDAGKFQETLDDWESEGEKKVVLRGENHIHLQNLQKAAEIHYVHSYLIRDAGRTQIPANSVTVLALFGSEDDVNLVSGDLALL